MKKIQIISDKNKSSTKIKITLLKILSKAKIKRSNISIVIGGDGFMLKTLKKYQKYNKPFYGMNRGTFGFLMNKFKSKNIEKFISRAKTISISVRSG